MAKTKKQRVVADFIRSGGLNVRDIAAKHKITRQAVYGFVRNIDRGSKDGFRMCQDEVRLECLWRTTYQPWFECIPVDEIRSNTFVRDEFKRLLRQMKMDKFPIAVIARKTGKNRATILHHLQ